MFNLVDSIDRMDDSVDFNTIDRVEVDFHHHHHPHRRRQKQFVVRCLQI